jgi:hypothetical protein
MPRPAESESWSLCRYENENTDSDFFDYKWVLKTRHIYKDRLHDAQAVNHFGKSFACLTTKVGLLKVVNTKSC